MVPDNADKKSCSCEHRTTLFWCGPGKNVPVLHFRPDVCLYKNSDCSCSKMVTSGTGLTFKFVKTECRLLRQLLEGHGFREIHQNSNDFNIMWCGCHVKPYTLRGLTELQKVNHFPRSYEITRKDRLYKNYMRMRQSMGARHFNFLPVTFVLPSEVNEFYSTFQRERGYWIAKPVASSRGRGISIISHPNQVNLDEQIVVCKYISNPLLVDGFKFDLRIYVMVTSFDPLRIYIFNEGLARFSTVRYDGSPLNLNNIYMHLTNYSINKKSSGYVKCSDPDIEDYGNKWSMSALLRYLKNEGYDTASMMMRVEDLIIKTLLSAEVPIANACRMFLPHRENCFELFGFDVIFDEDQKPWLLEVNLSPSLACESPLDLKIKSNLLSQMLTLAGVVALDPYSKREYGGGRRKSATSNGYSMSVDGTNVAPLSNEDLRLVRQTKEEFVRKGAFFRVFPTEDSWDTYSQFLENKTHYNFMLHSQLYPNKSKEKSRPASSVVTMNKFREMNAQPNSNMTAAVASNIQERYSRYEKSLQPLGSVEDYPPEALADAVTPDFSAADDILTDTTKDDLSTTDSSSAAAATKKSTSVRDIPKSNKVTKSPKKVSDNRPPDPSSKVKKSAPSPEHKPPPETPSAAFVPQEIVNKAAFLSKVQARQVFASYLNQLQDDLLEDIGDSDPKQYEEQMETVLRFLTRASTNLHLQVFRVVVPSKKLPLSDQRRILAKELGDFIHIYSKETGQLAQRVRMRQLLLQTKDSDERGVTDESLTKFLCQVAECDLEKVLVGYSAAHQSSALFLGEINNEDISSLIKTKPRPNVQSGGVKIPDAQSIEEVKKVEPPVEVAKKRTSEHPDALARDTVLVSRDTGTLTRATTMVSRDKPGSRDPVNLSKSSSKLSMGTVSSGYGSFVSSGSANGKICIRPSTATGTSKSKVKETMSRLSKSPMSNNSSRKKEVLKQWNSASSETLLSQYKPGARDSETRDAVSRDCASRSNVPGNSTSRDKSRKSGRPITAGSKQKINSSSSDISLIKPPHRPREQKSREQKSRDQISLKTAAPLKNPRSKQFVQSVWTEEFCKLMDLRMYLH